MKTAAQPECLPGSPPGALILFLSPVVILRPPPSQVEGEGRGFAWVVQRSEGLPALDLETDEEHSEIGSGGPPWSAGSEAPAPGTPRALGKESSVQSGLGSRRQAGLP